MRKKEVTSIRNSVCSFFLELFGQWVIRELLTEENVKLTRLTTYTQVGPNGARNIVWRLLSPRAFVRGSSEEMMQLGSVASCKGFLQDWSRCEVYSHSFLFHVYTWYGRETFGLEEGKESVAEITEYAYLLFKQINKWLLRLHLKRLFILRKMLQN